MRGLATKPLRDDELHNDDCAVGNSSLDRTAPKTMAMSKGVGTWSFSTSQRQVPVAYATRNDNSMKLQNPSKVPPPLFEMKGVVPLCWTEEVFARSLKQKQTEEVVEQDKEDCTEERQAVEEKEGGVEKRFQNAEEKGEEEKKDDADQEVTRIQTGERETLPRFPFSAPSLTSASPPKSALRIHHFFPVSRSIHPSPPRVALYNNATTLPSSVGSPYLPSRGQSATGIHGFRSITPNKLFTVAQVRRPRPISRNSIAPRSSSPD